MRVVHVSKVKGIAGSERHLLMLLPALAREGVDVSMVVLEEPDVPAAAFCQALEERGVPAECLPIRWHLDPVLPGRLARRFRSLAPDIVHTHLLHADLYGLPAARRAGIPHAISTRHNDNPFRRNPLIRALNQRAMCCAGRVIAISEALNGFVRDVEGIEAGRVVTVRYGMEPHQHAEDARERARGRLGFADEPLIGAFGRLISQKGFDVLLEAFVLLRQGLPEARLVIVGDGHLRAELERQARALNLAEAVTFTGWVEDAPALMPACDVIAMPSRWEGFGLVALETMDAARPLVASAVSALPEIVVDGETGLLVPPGDPAALAGALSALLTDPAHAAALGRAGRERLLGVFSIEQMVQATLKVYAGVIGNGRKNHAAAARSGER